MYIIETARLGLRKLEDGDFEALFPILGDPEVMYAWEHGFSDAEVREWLGKNQKRYERDGFSYFAAIDRATGRLVGVIGPLMEDIDGMLVPGVAYIVGKEHWGQGYAPEGAAACIRYLFSQRGADKVIASIRPDNAASLRVAKKLGMAKEGEHSKPVNGREVLHHIYSASK
ncbi:MAG TPA: GNAT family N-acetyltransferase [Terriglobales bacterium]|nr:GNAT family N-acetyltransferase [Terriglobales bacterium]